MFSSLAPRGVMNDPTLIELFCLLCKTPKCCFVPLRQAVQQPVVCASIQFHQPTYKNTGEVPPAYLSLLKVLCLKEHSGIPENTQYLNNACFPDSRRSFARIDEFDAECDADRTNGPSAFGLMRVDMHRSSHLDSRLRLTPEASSSHSLSPRELYAPAAPPPILRQCRRKSHLEDSIQFRTCET